MSFAKAAAQYEFDSEAPPTDAHHEWVVDNLGDIVDSVYASCVEDGTLYDFVWECIDSGDVSRASVRRLEKILRGRVERLYNEAM